MRPKFTLEDAERANDAWSANCGPCSLAAILDLTLDAVRPFFEPFPGYTNPSCMMRALELSGARWVVDAHLTGDGPLLWPRKGLCRVQWEGPWTKPGVPMKARYRQTHWVGSMRDGPDVGVWDVNALGNGTGWIALADWERVLVPFILESYPRASGGWHLTHAIEVDR